MNILKIKLSLVQVRIKKKGEHLAHPPRKKVKNFLQKIYGKKTGSIWGNPLHVSVDGTVETKKI